MHYVPIRWLILSVALLSPGVLLADPPEERGQKESSAKELKERFERLSKRYDELQAQRKKDLEKITELIKAQRKRLKEYQARFTSLEKPFDELRAARDKLQKENLTLAKTLGEATESSKAVTDVLQSIRGENNALRRQNTLLRKYLTRSLQSKTPAERRRAAETLGALGKEGRFAIPSLTKALKDKDPTVRRAAAAALEKIKAKVDGTESNKTTERESR